MKIEELEFEAINTKVDFSNLDDSSVLRVVKKNKIMAFDENTYARLVGSSFYNGTIEVKMRSRLLEDAPDFARGFIGIAYRINADNSSFESFYIRPTNGRIDDPVRKNRGVQYFSYPTYTFDYFREKGITDYEGPADIGLDEWILLKAVIQDDTATFYLNDCATPVLVVSPMKQIAANKGGIGLFVDIGTEGFFKDLVITSND